jgi:hypothetical protein
LRRHQCSAIALSALKVVGAVYDLVTGKVDWQ